jgi:hypothetical protein
MKKKDYSAGFVSLTFFKEQVMLNPDITTSRLVSVKMPSVLLPSLYRPTNIFVMFNFNTFPFFQLSHHLIFPKS